jgi:hypothetical protein
MDKLELLSDVLCLTETSKVRRKFVETTEELKSLEHDDDESTKKIVAFLVERNKKLIDCLDYVKDQLPKLMVVRGGEDKKFFEMTEAINRLDTLKAPIKLFVTDKRLDIVKTADDHLEFLGTVEIGGGDSSDAREEESLKGKIFSGFIESTDGSIEEVLLIYKTRVGKKTNDNIEDTATRIQFEGDKQPRKLLVMKVDLLPTVTLRSDGLAKTVAGHPVARDEPGKAAVDNRTWVTTRPDHKNIIAANQNTWQNSIETQQPIEVPLKDFKRFNEASQDLESLDKSFKPNLDESSPQISSNQSEVIPQKDPIKRNFYVDLR